LCYEKLNNLIKARKYYLLARNLDPMEDEIYFFLGNTYKAEAQWRLAANYYERAISLQDRNEDYYIALAEAYFKCDESHKADLYYRRATEIGPEIPTPWVRYAEFYKNANKPEMALEILMEAEDYTTGAEIYYCRAAILFEQGERFDGMENLGEGLQIDFDMHSMFFEYIPSLREDREIKAIIKYYEFG
jgi:tetratricopeptide (TPR) repeat protein